MPYFFSTADAPNVYALVIGASGGRSVIEALHDCEDEDVASRSRAISGIISQTGRTSGFGFGEVVAALGRRAAD